MPTSNLQESGFCVVRNAVDSATLAAMREFTEDLIHFVDHQGLDPFYKYYLPHRNENGVFLDVFQRHPEFHNWAKLPSVLDQLENVIGPDIFLYENSLLYKPKGKKNGVPWHQDFISRAHEPIKYIVWVAIDDAKIENGCLKVIPGSHKNGLYPYHTVQGEAHHSRINQEYVDESKAIYLEMDAGDAVIFSSHLFHSSEEVHSDKPRRAFRAAYQGFDEITVPRGAPFVVRGGTPKSLAQRFNNQNDLLNRILMENKKLKAFHMDFIKFLTAPHKPTLIFGTGSHAENVFKSIQLVNEKYGSELKISGFLDNDKQKWGAKFFDIDIIAPSIELINKHNVIIASSYYNEIYCQLINLGVSKSNIILA
ncbi:phytanoyl-CoA dioxygenase family protein [Cohnella sp.]|uniref:phytanoyl-CoA dioxygenase family protein n=1 Tax=Cohnella sp. TaxID=1883426 RepID=UPI003562830D